MSDSKDDKWFEQSYREDVANSKISNPELLTNVQTDVSDHPLSDAKDDKWFEQSYKEDV